MMEVKSRVSSLRNSKREVSFESLVEIFDVKTGKTSTRKSSELKLDSDVEEDVTNEPDGALTKSSREKNDTSSYRELPDQPEKFVLNQSFQELAEIHRSWKYYEENVVISSDNYGGGEQEEELYSSESGSTGKFVDKVPDEFDGADESVYNCFGFLDDTPAEILRDRGALMEKIVELKNVYPELHRKNRLLQYWVGRVMTKKHQTMTPEYDETLSPTVSEERYIKRLINYKTEMDEIEARQCHIKDQLDILENRVKNILEEDNEIFGKLLDREREIGVGLIFGKSGRVLSQKAINVMIRRQVLHRELLNHDRFNYIFLRHRYEDIKMAMRLAETLGEGMTIMDYDVIQMVNYNLRDKLEEREKELEKLFVKIQEFLNELNNFKEKDLFNRANIYNEKLSLEKIEADAENARENCNTVRHELSRIRENFLHNKSRGGMLFALPVLREMEKTLKRLNDLRTKIERMEEEVRSYPAKEDEQREVRNDGTPAASAKLHVAGGARTTVTRMTKVKRSESSRNKPGRC